MLRCFRTVADHGSLSEAAAVLGRTPSAVSMMLKQFEDHIGAPLFETARKSRLTPLGELVLHEAGRGLSHFDRTLAAIEGLSRAERGHVRLAVTPSAAESVRSKCDSPRPASCRTSSPSGVRRDLRAVSKSGAP